MFSPRAMPGTRNETRRSKALFLHCFIDISHCFYYNLLPYSPPFNTTVLKRQHLMDAATKAYPLCGAKTRSGRPCAKYQMSGKRRCRLHGGLSTGPKTAEGRARIAAAQLKHGRYVNWREKRTKERHYLAEIERLLHQARRAGFLPD